MGIFDYFKNRREQKKMQEEYATLDNGQLQVALAEMYERLMFVGKSIKDRGEVIYDLSSDAKSSWEVDNFEMRMNALLSVVKDRVGYHTYEEGGKHYITRDISSAPKAEFLDFKGANPKLAKMEAKLMGYGLAFKVPEMKKYEQWRDGQDFKDGPVTLTPFSQHSSRYNDSIATKKDLLEISSPEEIKRTVMSQADIEKNKAEMAKQEYLGGAFVNIVDPAQEIIDDLSSSTELFFKKCEEKGLKRSDVLAAIKEFSQSDILKKYGDNDYHVTDAMREKYPQIYETSRYSPLFTQIASAISKHRGYMPAITEFLKEAGNFDDEDKRRTGQENVKRLAEYMRRQHRGELSDFTDKKSVQGALKSGNEKATSLARLGRADSLGLKKDVSANTPAKTLRTNTDKTKSVSVANRGESR